MKGCTAPILPEGGNRRWIHGCCIGEVCALTWQNIDLKEQTITVRHSMRYNGVRHKTEISTTKRNKVRTVDFCDTLAAILKTAKAGQHKNHFQF